MFVRSSLARAVMPIALIAGVFVSQSPVGMAGAQTSTKEYHEWWVIGDWCGGNCDEGETCCVMWQEE